MFSKIAIKRLQDYFGAKNVILKENGEIRVRNLHIYVDAITPIKEILYNSNVNDYEMFISNDFVDIQM